MPDNTDAKTLDRIKALKMTRSFGDYVESSKSDCILACKNMVELTLRNPIRDAFRQFSSPVTGSFGVTITTSGDGAGQGVPTTGSNQARNSKLPEDDPLSSIERELNNLFSSTFTEVATSFAKNFEGVQTSIVETIADGTYKACLADCVDDQRKVWPAKLSRCWIEARNEEDALKCSKMQNDLQRWQELQGEIGRLERELQDLHKDDKK